MNSQAKKKRVLSILLLPLNKQTNKRTTSKLPSGIRKWTPKHIASRRRCIVKTKTLKIKNTANLRGKRRGTGKGREGKEPLSKAPKNNHTLQKKGGGDRFQHAQVPLSFPLIYVRYFSVGRHRHSKRSPRHASDAIREERRHQMAGAKIERQERRLHCRHEQERCKKLQYSAKQNYGETQDWTTTSSIVAGGLISYFFA
jgi:hypothetical protein